MGIKDGWVFINFKIKGIRLNKRLKVHFQETQVTDLLQRTSLNGQLLKQQIKGLPLKLK